MRKQILLFQLISRTERLYDTPGERSGAGPTTLHAHDLSIIVCLSQILKQFCNPFILMLSGYKINKLLTVCRFLLLFYISSPEVININNSTQY